MTRPLDDERLSHLLRYAKAAVDLLGDLPASALDDDLRTLLAVTHAVQIVGEAAWKLSDERRAAYPDVEWDGAIRMRHILVHDYFEVNTETLWRTIRHDLPPMIETLERAGVRPEGDA